MPRRRERADEENAAAPLYLDFDLEDADEEPGAAGPPGSAAGADPGGDGGLVDYGPGVVRWWQRLDRGRQRLLVGAVVMVAAAAVGGGGLVAHAERSARDRVAVTALEGSYVPSPDGNGLDLLLTLRDDGPAVATLIWVGVNQPGLALGYPPLPLPITVGHTLGVKLEGRYTCKGAAGSAAKTFTLVVQSPRGVISQITLPMPSGAVLPSDWKGDRDSFCTATALLPSLPEV
jgi:hypothetical protein